MIGIISDTHDNIIGIKKAVEVFKQRKTELVLHLGDIVAPVTVLYFKGLRIKFLKGNCDGDIEMIEQKAKEIDGEFLGLSSELNIRNKKIALIHKPDKANEMALSGQYDYLLHGHTHQKRDEKIGNTRIINPGGLYLGNDEHSIALLDIKEDKLEFVKIN